MTAPQAHPRNALQGGPLHPNAAIAQEYAAAILTLVRKLHEDTRREMERVFSQSVHHGAAMDDKDSYRLERQGELALSGSVAPQARIALAALLEKYDPMFGRLARKATRRMIERTLKNSAVTLGMSLREIAKDLTLKPVMTERLREIITASTAEAAGLITRIPQEYFGQVQGAVMRSIVGGDGLKDLVPFLNEKYGQKIRWARMVAMDQTRKSYSNITTCRMKDVGVTQYVWLHLGGSTHPRALHVELSGTVCDLDDPPYIGDMYDRPVYGHPGTLPNCRCVMRPVIKFKQD